jgi:ABC-2 type transport system ATP-binding protein
MSIIVNNLTKTYGTQQAVAGINFEARKGEVLGFLGPNGAGKTTTMKIVTCFIPQTTGTATVCGFDTLKNSMEVRQRIGYLPEHNPLYKDMYVKEYLTFVGGLHKVANLKRRVAEMIDRTGLAAEQNKHIGALSKGYRQRVGLAQAMLHNPEVLILDEPTTGLDPNQLIEIRSLIRELAAEKTVILSTHIMQEVEALCQRVIIINKGELVANDTIEGLRSRSKTETIITVEFVENVTLSQVQKIKDVTAATALAANRFQLRAATDIRPAVAAFATQNKLTIIEINREQTSVQDIFQTLTQ